MAARRGKRFDYDLVILGGGSAGIVAGNVAGALGVRVALVEKARIGGECLWTGCVPSKALLHVADVARQMKTGRDVGLQNVPLSRDDCAGAFDYVRRKVAEVRENDATEQMLRDFGVEIFYGAPEFVSPHLVRTPAGDLRGAAFLVATGSSAATPKIAGLAEAGCRVNETLYDLDHVPSSLVCIGGGWINCEMGQALARLGSRVTIVHQGPRLLEAEDAELTDLLTSVLRSEGIEVLLNTQATAARKGEDEGKLVTVTLPGGQTRDIACEEILVAVGRKANSGSLGLDKAGVVLDEKNNVSVDAAGRTSAPHIFACGDVTGRFQFSHMAEHEAKIVVRNALFPGAQAIPYDVVPWSTFTDPELARVGLTEQQAKEKHGAKNVQVLRHHFRQDDRAIVENQTTGLVKIITTGRNGTVVGAHILGPNAGDMIHEWIIAMRHKLPVRVIADLIHVYPTVSVSNQRAAQKWYADLMRKPLVKGALSAVFGFQPRDASKL